MDDLPDLLPPDRMPPIRTAEDLYDLWRALMGPHGQSRRNLWFQVLDADDRVTGVISRVDDVPEDPDGELVRNLLVVLADVCGPGESAAVCLTRPGWAEWHDGDLAWAAQLAAAAARRSIRLRPTFLAGSDGVIGLPVDAEASAA
jgi:hypothetical protein